ncbi:ATPase [Bacillus sp. 165]|uniref:ATPase n=1 Tax=Bacillus sp. 165 TaxID=1529117 RepID=UPI001ADB2CE4|nr:ATPase [Bacillus sp. 165]MBO9128281.1 ATPase [Bacillus sp. 165]
MDTSMRDVILHTLGNGEKLVISTDNAGAIGEKEGDIVSVPYSAVAYYTARVALMECIAVGGEPEVIVVQNFINNDVYVSLLEGIHRASEELFLHSIAVTGSSETNFSLIQSCVGITVIGKVKEHHLKINRTPNGARFAVIGKPLVGEAVVSQQEQVLPLSLFRKLVAHEAVFEVVPVGSKGVSFELEALLQVNKIHYKAYKAAIDIKVSAGPSTCVVISYNAKEEKAIQRLCNTHFYPITMEL